MSITYNKLLANMKNEFFKLTGITPDNAGDMGVRLQVLACELYSLSCYGDFVLKQAFPQTATGEYLDMHANQRGVFRKGSSSAKGSLTFSLKEPLEADVEISKGTICSYVDNPKISFATDESAIIPAGKLSITVTSQSIGQGEEYNVKENTITTMVTPPTFVFSVTNNESFTGGCNNENDNQLRDRLLTSIKDFANGFNKETYCQRIEALDFVLNANVVSMWDLNSSSTVKAYVRTKSGQLTDENILEIEDLFSEKIIAGFTLSVENAQASTVDFTVNLFVSSGYDESLIKQQVKEIVETTFGKRKIGENVSLVKLSREISSVDGIESFDFDSFDDRLFITAEMTKYIKLGKLEVLVNE